jgi:serine phosphatase RsbU (regulator of sigma subunit)
VNRREQPCDRSPDLPEPDYRRVFHLAPAPLVLLTPDLAVVDANRAYLESLATTLEELIGRPVSDLPNPDDPRADGPAGLRRSLERARNTRRPDTVLLQRNDVRMPDGTHAERFWSYRSVPILDTHGDVALLLHRADDITDYVRYRIDAASDVVGGEQWAERVHQAEADLFSRTQELEQANAELLALSERQRHTAQSLAGLATTVSALSAADSRAELLRQMFRHGRSALQADVLAVALLEPGGGHLAVVDTRREGGAEPVRRLSIHSPVPMAAAAAGRPVFQEDAADSGATAPLEGLAAWAALPLRIGGRPLGSLTVGWERRHVFEDNDVRVLEAFAAQCSQAVNRVARRETERRQANATRSLAETLQRSLLTDPPRPEHLDIAVRYRPAAREVQIGGDWYDAFLSPAGDTTLVVGDVTGHDWTAAAVAGQLRNMLRGVSSALEHRYPEQVLSGLDRALRETGIGMLATALVAHVEEPPATAPDRFRVLRWSNAGHPPPLLIAPDGRANLLERPVNLLLGVDPDAPRQHHAVALRPGTTVVLYTDGLVERRDASLDEGLGRLLAAAPGLAGRPVDEVCDELLDRLDPDLTDDIALLAVRVRDDGTPARP